MGSGSLEYNVGVLEYIQDNSLMNVTMTIAVAMGSLLGIILMIFLVCTLVLSGRFIWRNCSKRLAQTSYIAIIVAFNYPCILIQGILRKLLTLIKMDNKNSHHRNMIMSVTRMCMKISATSPLRWGGLFNPE